MDKEARIRSPEPEWKPPGAASPTSTANGEFPKASIHSLLFWAPLPVLQISLLEKVCLHCNPTITVKRHKRKPVIADRGKKGYCVVGD